MKILSIDTSSNICGIAILEDTKILKEVLQDNGLTHSETLMPIIKNTFSELDINLTDIDLIVCDIGPGSFTGIRIGVATAKAFADSLNIKSIGINSLECLAYNSKTNGLICSIIDAKNDNIYTSIFEKTENDITCIYEHISKNIDEFLEEIKIKYSEPITFIGDGAMFFKDKISKIIPNSIFLDNNTLSAYNLGIAGLNKFKKGEFSDILPLYLKKPQAERILEEKKNG